jgi:hypothetical protein
MIVLKIILWVLVIVVGLLVLLLLFWIGSYYWPRNKRDNIYYKMWFSYEMCAIKGKGYRKEITEEEEYAALEKEYLANKAIIDQYAMVHKNAENMCEKWGFSYGSVRATGPDYTPIPIIAQWSDEFLQFGLKKIAEGVRPNFFNSFRNPIKAHRL